VVANVKLVIDFVDDSDDGTKRDSVCRVDDYMGQNLEVTGAGIAT
jgi:hypothetical protein